jgi:hypothetical protein
LTIEGHNGKSIIIEQVPFNREGMSIDAMVVDTFTKEEAFLTGLSALSGRPSGGRKSDNERKKGLTILNPNGLKDNTGFALNINDNGSLLEIKPVSKTCCNNILIKVPNTMSIKGRITGVNNKNSIKVSKIQGEIDISTQYNSIFFEDITGPVMASASYGSIEGSLAQVIKEPITITTASGSIDLKFQPMPKINFKIITPYGNTYVPDDLDIELTPKTEGLYADSKVEGKINGGGPLIFLKSDYGNVYLRTK